MAGAYLNALYDAAELARYKVVEAGLRQLKSFKGGIYALYPVVNMLDCEFGVGVVDEYHYLVYQDEGFQTFPMRSLTGKTVPMMIDGNLVFRRVSNVGRFKKGGKPDKIYWRRDDGGMLYPSPEQERRWTHPGLPPKDFIDEGVREAAIESAPDIYAALVEDMEEGYEGPQTGFLWD